MNDDGTHRDLRSDKLFFFEEAEGTNHSLTIHNLEHNTEYEVTLKVFNPYGEYSGGIRPLITPPGSYPFFLRLFHFLIPQNLAGTQLYLNQISLWKPRRTA